LFGVVEEEPGGFGGGVGEKGAVFGGGDLGISREGFAVNNHELGAMVRRRKMEHAHAGSVFGKSETVLRHERGERCAVRFGIGELFGVVAEKRFDVIVERKAADFDVAGEIVIVGVFVGGKKPLELEPVEAGYAAMGVLLDEKMLLGDGVAIEIDDLGADVAELAGEGEFGSGQFARGESLALDMALDRRQRRGLRGCEGGRDDDSQQDSEEFH